MRKIITVCFVLLAAAAVPCMAAGAKMPDTMYFNAMRDEMQRTLKELRLKDHQNPYYVAYWINEQYTDHIDAEFGQLTYSNPHQAEPGEMWVNVFVDVGNDKNNSSGYTPGDRSGVNLPGMFKGYTFRSYDGIREKLWQMTDAAYLQSSDFYERKQLYKKKKNIVQKLPDVVPAEQSGKIEDVPAWQDLDKARIEPFVKELSAQGLSKTELDMLRISVRKGMHVVYYLNSRGGFYQTYYPSLQLRASAQLHLSDGRQSSFVKFISLRNLTEEELNRGKEEVEEWLQKVLQVRQVVKAKQPYIGPVLLKPRAAAVLFRNSVINEMEQSTPILLELADEDKGAGNLHKKKGMRVGTELVTLYDRPCQREFDGFTLPAYKCIDDEGVAAQDLTLMKNGKVQDIPLSMRPLDKGHKSNGHSRFKDNMWGRESVSTVFVEPTQQWTDEEMENKLLERCKALGLEYGYILHGWSGRTPSAIHTERVYVDGRREFVHNIEFENDFFTQRDLRAVLAVGGKQEITGSLVVPSVLMQEMEMVPRDIKGARPPFVPRPK